MSPTAIAQSKACTCCKEVKELSKFHRQGDKTYSQCKDCANRKRREKRKADPSIDKYNRFKQKYGLTPEQYEGMVEATPHCPICGSEEPLVVDHDHSTQEVRGLICNHCNLVLGHAKDNIETLKNAIAYLEQ